VGVWIGMLMCFSIVNVLSWIAQFIGHGVFEKRAPALKVRALSQWLSHVQLGLTAPRIILSKRSSWHRSSCGSRYVIPELSRHGFLG